MYLDEEAHEVNVKLVFHGPGLAGKTTFMQYIYERTPPDAKSKMCSHATETERQLSFSFVPRSLGPIGEYTARFHLYTVPGPVFYDVSRRLVMTGVDGVIFVADSQ